MNAIGGPSSNPAAQGGDAVDRRPWLLCRSGPQLAALPAEQVAEVLRPQPLDAIAEMPDFVLGLALLRGQPTPVLDLGRLLGAQARPAARWMRLRLPGRRLAVAVDAVLGLQALADWQALPPLLQGCAARGVEGLATLDRALLLLLQGGRLLPAGPWDEAVQGEGEP